MNVIAQIRKLSLWIFLIPFLAINLCLIISQNPEFFENTILTVDQIGRSGFSIPYLDGSLSISRASRTFPQYLIFKPAMILTAVLLYYYWNNNNKLVNQFRSTNIDYKFKTFGILSAIFLAIHSIFLGIKFDIQIYKLFRRVIMFAFIVFEIVAQAYLVATLLSFKEKLSEYINKNILKLKLCLKDWCNIPHQNINGWLAKEDIWGVYSKELYNVKFYQPIINQYWKILNSKFLN